MSRLPLLLTVLALSSACVEVSVYELEPEAPTDLDRTWPEEDSEATPSDEPPQDEGAEAEPDEESPEDSDLPEPDYTDAVYFDDPGVHSFTVPAGVSWVQVEAWGGGGAGGNQAAATGGGAAWAIATVPVTAGETLTLEVAEGGQDRGDGGGASWLLRDTEVLLVAAGGGGGGSDGCSGCKVGGAGGAGGGHFGEDGQDLLTGFNGYCDAATGGRGATQAAGGVGGEPFGSAQYQCDGEAGDLGRGGMAAGVWGTCEAGQGASGWRAGGGQGNGGGGAGGAGWYGGGGAGFIWTYCSGGGGGGSSWAHASAVDVVLQGGTGRTEARFSESDGAGQGGDVLGAGADGRMVVIPL